MSNAIRYDPLLVRYLAEELDRLLRGRACASNPYFAARRVALLPLDRGEALELDLHPLRGWVRIVPWEEEGFEADAVCTGVRAPLDERRLSIHIDAPDRFRSGLRRIEVELLGNQWNVFLVSSLDERIHSALWSRRAGDRALSPGAEYRAPTASARYGAAGTDDSGAAWTKWQEELARVAPHDRERVLIRRFAWTGSVNAPAVLGDAGRGQGRQPEEVALRAAFERWWSLRSLPPARPVLIRSRGGTQPYPLPLEGYDGDRVSSLLEAMERAAVSGGGESPREAVADGGLLVAARLRLEAAERRVQRLMEETVKEGVAERLREHADLLLSRLHEVRRGAAEAVLSGWDGEEVRLRLDPALSPADNAAAWYEEARKRTRAAERLPGLIAGAEREVERWREAVRRGEEGELPDWVGHEIGRDHGNGSRSAETGVSLPYRVFRSSGGLEIRVGRSSKANDQLTFRHSSPNDVWLHARSVPGSHVVLRWPDPEGSPPARDLEEAARLAAYFSKARTSGLVPVDWTRRKYVRKPRGAPPGSVIPQRVRTLFVEPGEPPEPSREKPG